jgi:hypothetical protein
LIPPKLVAAACRGSKFSFCGCISSDRWVVGDDLIDDFTDVRDGEGEPEKKRDRGEKKFGVASSRVMSREEKVSC